MKDRMAEAVQELDGFHVSNGWLELFKMSYGIRETTATIAGEASDVPITTVKAWTKRLPELIKIIHWINWGYFFKTLPQKGLVEKGKKGRGGKQSKKRCTIVLFVTANDSKVCEGLV